LFNHRVCKQLQRVGHREAEDGGGPEIDDKFISERKLNRQIAWLVPRNILSTYDAADRTSSNWLIP
jgi:hypothetical protein